MNGFDLLKPLGEGDVMWKWVTTLFPTGEVPSATGGSMAIYTSSILALAVVFLGFWVLFGIISSAYSGKVLGDRYHQIYGPLRVVFGIGLIIPTAGGMSASHYFLRDVAAVGALNLGNDVALHSTQQRVGKGETISPLQVGGDELALHVLEHEVCHAVHTQAAPGYYTEKLPPVEGKDTNGWFSPVVRQWDYGPACGSFSFKKLDEDQNLFENRRVQAVADVIGSMRPLAAYYGKEWEWGNAWASDRKDISKKVKAGDLPPDLVPGIRRAGAAYDSAISAAAHETASGQAREPRDRIVKMVEVEGWAALSKTYLTTAQVSRLTSELANEKPERTPPPIDQLHGPQAEFTKAAFKTLRAQILGESQFAGASANDLAAAGDENSNFLVELFASPLRGFMQWLLDGGPIHDAFAHIAATGVGLKIAAFAVIGAGAIAETASNNIITSNLGAGGGVGYLLDWAQYGIKLMFVLGWLRADLFPMIPFILVFQAIIAWIGAFIVAMIAVPLWGFVFVRMDGEEFIDQQQKAGLVLLFDLVLAPAFTVLAMVFGLTLFDIVYSQLNQWLADVVLGNTGGSIPGVGTLISFYIFDTWLAFMIAVNLFGLIGGIKDRILEWMGERVSDHGVGGETVAAATAGKALADKTPPKNFTGKAKAGGDTPAPAGSGSKFDRTFDDPNT